MGLDRIHHAFRLSWVATILAASIGSALSARFDHFNGPHDEANVVNIGPANPETECVRVFGKPDLHDCETILTRDITQPMPYIDYESGAVHLNNDDHEVNVLSTLLTEVLPNDSIQHLNG